jgi:hypothetical protein
MRLSGRATLDDRCESTTVCIVARMWRPLVVVSAVVVVLVAGCGSPKPTGDLFGEYLRSTTVENDRFRGATTADRLAEFAAEGGPQQVLGRLLAAYRCDSCDPGDSVDEAVLAYADGNGQLYGRTLLVRHRDGQLELVTVYVVQAPGVAPQLLDPKGRAYTGLDDFLDGNSMFTHDDTVLTYKDITAIPGGGEVVTVTGHNRSGWWSAGVAALVVLGTVVLLVVSMAVVGWIRNRRADRALLATWSADSGSAGQG